MPDSAVMSLTLQGGVVCSGSRCSCCCCCCSRPRSCPRIPGPPRRVGGPLPDPGEPPVLSPGLAPPPALPSGKPSFPFLLSVPGMGEGPESAGEGFSGDPRGCVALDRALQGFSLRGRGVERTDWDLMAALGERTAPLQPPHLFWAPSCPGCLFLQQPCCFLPGVRLGVSF